MAKGDKDNIKDEIEVVFESIEIGGKAHLWQYDDSGKQFMDTLYDMVGQLCPACQLKALSMLCAAITCDIIEEGQEPFRELLFKLIKQSIEEINDGHKVH